MLPLLSDELSRALDAADKHCADRLHDGLRELWIELAEPQFTLEKLRQVATSELGTAIEPLSPARRAN